MCKDLFLHPIGWLRFFQVYFFYGKADFEALEPHEAQLCMLTNTLHEEKKPLSDEIRDMDDSAFPIKIGISPYATQRDVLDFVKKLFSSVVQPMLDDYKSPSSKIGKMRKKRKRERDSRIYEIKEQKPIQRIRTIKKEFGEDLDFGEVTKIISVQKKKRR